MCWATPLRTCWGVSCSTGGWPRAFSASRMAWSFGSTGMCRLILSGLWEDNATKGVVGTSFVGYPAVMDRAKSLVLISQELEADRIETLADHVKLLGCSPGEIGLPAWTKGATVVDGNDNGAAVAQVGDLNPGAEGQGAVRGGHGIHVEWATAGGETPLEHGAVPTGEATLDPGEDRGAGSERGGGGDGGDAIVGGDV